MGGKYGKFVLALLIIGNFISIEINTDELKAGYETVRNAISNIFKPSESSKPDIEKLKILVEEADRLYKAQDFYNLIEVTNEIIRLAPDFSEAYNLRGIAYKNLKQYDKALENYNTVIELDPNSDGAYNNRGSLYKDLKEYEWALEDFLRAIEINENNYAVYANVGEIFYELGDYPKAIDFLNKSIELGSQQGIADKDLGEILYYRGLAHMKAGNKRQGQSDLIKSKELGYPD